MFKKGIVQTLQHLQKEVELQKLLPPMGDRIAEEYQGDAFVLLVMCLMSLRARDSAVYPVCHRLFARTRTPQQLAELPLDELEAIIRPIGFYKKKAKILKNISRILVELHNSSVPRTEQDLLKLPGVGRKTANFMVGWAFKEAALCVDTHVHRLANKFGWVKTKNPEQTEVALKELVPSEWWVLLNTLLVMWGQQICPPRLAQKNRPHHNAVCPCMWKSKPLHR